MRATTSYESNSCGLKHKPNSMDGLRISERGVPPVSVHTAIASVRLILLRRLHKYDLPRHGHSIEQHRDALARLIDECHAHLSPARLAGGRINNRGGNVVGFSFVVHRKDWLGLVRVGRLSTMGTRKSWRLAVKDCHRQRHGAKDS